MYAKIVDDKEMGSLMTGIYFGGVYDDKEAANQAAKESAVSCQGSIIIPKSFPLEDKTLQQIVSDAIKTFDKMSDNIYEAERVMKKKR